MGVVILRGRKIKVRRSIFLEGIKKEKGSKQGVIALDFRGASGLLTPGLLPILYNNNFTFSTDLMDRPP